MIHLRTLGTTELLLDGEPAPRQLTWRKNLGLLLYLARSPGRQRSRDHLVGLLWGDKPESPARHSLNEALRVIRRFAGDDVVSSDAGGIVLAERAVSLDVDLLEERLASEDWTGAADVARGTFMEGFRVPDSSAFEDWLAAERRFWQRRSVEALVGGAHAALQEGDLRRARRLSERAAALDPFSNGAIRAGMKATALEGERSGALDLYARFVARLDGELGIEPDAETARLADRVRRQRSWQLPEALRREPRTARRVPLIGRAAALRRALEVWRGAAARSRAAAVFVSGDPGIGKTRFLEEIVARARLEGATTAGIRAVEGDATAPWSGVLALAGAELLEAPGLLSAAPASLAALAAHLSAWRERFADETEGVVPAGLGRALSDIVQSITEEEPFVLVVDDVEWLDAESVHALEVLLRDCATRPLVVLLASARPRSSGRLDDLRSRIGREVDGTAIELGPLSNPELGALARAILPEYDEDEVERVARRIEVDSAGIPLLAVEILQAVRGGLGLSLDSGGWPQPYKTLDQTIPGDLPDSVVASIRVGFRRLGQDAQAALVAASVLGDRVELDRLAAATELSGQALTRALDELEWARWLIADPRGYGFRARIVREIVERDMLMPGQRRRLRQAAGLDETKGP